MERTHNRQMRAAEVVDDTLDSVPQRGHVQVDEQADLMTGEPQVRQWLAWWIGKRASTDLSSTTTRPSTRRSRRKSEARG
jgi:hypothetical protein